MSNTQERLKDSGFYEVYAFYQKTGIITTTAIYGIMSELYAELTFNGRKSKRLNTGCSGCITNAMKMIYEKWPL